MIHPSDHQLLAALKSALAEGGRVVRRFAARGFRVAYKGVTDPVTSADRAAERAIVKTLRGRFPDHGFLMEESGERVTRSPCRWVIDPIDGTVNFAHGVPFAAVSIGLEINGRVRMGGVLNPFQNELFLSVQGRGATLNGKKIRVSRTRLLRTALLATGFPYDRHTMSRAYLALVSAFLERCQDLRRFGSAALDMAYVACGRFDGYWEFNLKPWDSAAGLLLVREAGGTVTDFEGRPYTLADTRHTLATNGRLQSAMEELIKINHHPPA